VTTSFEAAPELKPGQSFTGRWNRGFYTIERLLGAGANGLVYLARRGGRVCALKFGREALDLQAEISALKALGRHEPELRGYLLEADDAPIGGREVPFYAMRYVQGVQIGAFLEERGTDWFSPLALQLLGKLQAIHRSGYVFGDLKRDNVLVTRSGTVELIDYGGVTRQGRSIRQFTELYDRGYWNAGDRKAEPSYDLFSFAVLCLQLCDPLKELDDPIGVMPQRRHPGTLLGVLERCRLSPAAKEIVRGILEGRRSDSGDVYEAWKRAAAAPEKRREGARGPSLWLSGALAISALAFFVSLYILLL